MAVAISTTRLAEKMCVLQENLDQKEGGERRYQVQRVCIYATVLGGRSLHNYDDCIAKQEALEWQADPDDVEDDVEVLHHLKQQAAMVPLLSQVVSGSDGMEPATTLVASVHSSSFAVKTRGRPLPSFHRCSFRWSQLITRSNIHCITSSGSKYNKNLPPSFPELLLSISYDKYRISRALSGVVESMNASFPQFAFLQWQVDVVDLCSWRSPPTSRPAKRQRAAVNPFLQVSDPPVVGAKSRGDRLPNEKGFNGVRYRIEQRRWEAMMKPPKFQNKKYFGSFKDERKAARAVDAAFHHYGRPDLLNFPHSSPQLLATRPAAGAELDESAMLTFVKDEAKWLASVATDLPLLALPSNSLPVSIPQPSASFNICPSFQFCSIIEILCEADDAVSQPGQWMQLDPLDHVVPSGMLIEEPVSGGHSSVQITEQITEQGSGGEEGYRLAALPMVGNSSACEMESPWLDSLLRSSPASMYPLPSTPRHFEEEMELAWLEQQSC